MNPNTALTMTAAVALSSLHASMDAIARDDTPVPRYRTYEEQRRDHKRRCKSRKARKNQKLARRRNRA